MFYIYQISAHLKGQHHWVEEQKTHTDLSKRLLQLEKRRPDNHRDSKYFRILGRKVKARKETIDKIHEYISKIYKDHDIHSPAIERRNPQKQKPQASPYEY